MGGGLYRLPFSFSFPRLGHPDATQFEPLPAYGGKQPPCPQHSSYASLLRATLIRAKL